MTTYDPAYNPTPDALHAINPDLIIPTDYAGTDDDPFLAALVAERATTGERSLAEHMADNDPEPTLAAGSIERYLNLADRYQVPRGEQHMLVYHFTPALPGGHSAHNHYYILMLSVHYRQRLNGMAPTIMRFLANSPTPEEPYLTTPFIDRIIDANDFLRAEGIHVDLDDLQRIATYWTKEEIYGILSHGITAKEALNFTRIGIRDAQEIIENHGLLADSFMQELINPTPDPDRL